MTDWPMTDITNVVGSVCLYLFPVPFSNSKERTGPYGDGHNVIPNISPDHTLAPRNVYSMQPALPGAVR